MTRLRPWRVRRPSPRRFAEGGCDSLTGGLPVSLHGSGRAAERLGDLLLFAAEVPDQPKNFSLIRGQAIDHVVKRRPTIEFRAVIGGQIGLLNTMVAPNRVRVVVGGMGPRAGVFSCQIDQFAVHLRGGEGEQVSGGRRLDICQRPMEPHEPPLQDVARVVPSTDDRKVRQHPAGDDMEPGHADLEDVLASTGIAGSQTGQAAGDRVVQCRGVDAALSHAVCFRGMGFLELGGPRSIMAKRDDPLSAAGRQPCAPNPRGRPSPRLPQIPLQALGLGTVPETATV